MANENVKIIIKEDDQTSPQGAGTSSDVAYIPGLALDEDSITKNIPVLCNTLSEFKAAFGSKPYQFTAEDVNNVKVDTTYKVGDYDLSYIYASELLNAGMSVIYENIAPEAESLTNIAKIDIIGRAETETSNEGSEVLTLSEVTADEIEVNKFVYTACKTETDTVSYVFKFKLEGLAPEYGAVTLLTEFPDKTSTKVDCVLKEIIAENNNTLFEIDNVGHTIEWSGLTDKELTYTTFNVQVDITYSGDQDTAEYPFHLYIVNGKNVALDSEVAVSSRIQYFYEQLNSRLDRIEDRSEYSVKYITSGGFPLFGIGSNGLADTLIDAAYQRGDAVALVDHINNPKAPLTGQGSIYQEAQYWFENADERASFGAMFTPWAQYACVTMNSVEDQLQYLPASFAYLMCMATAIKTSPNWLAMAGVTRGGVPNIKSLHTGNQVLTNVIAEDYQPKFGATGNSVSINAITNIRPYGLTIWGNRTLYPVDLKGTVARNFLNTRNMISDIKKLAYDTARKLMFEQNSDSLWIRFKSGMKPLLERLVTGNGISDYKLIKGTTKYNGEPLTKGEMAAVIKIYPRYAVEYFEITVVVSDNDVTVE